MPEILTILEQCMQEIAIHKTTDGQLVQLQYSQATSGDQDSSGCRPFSIIYIVT